MRDPLTKQPLLLHEPDSLVQSRNLCFPLRIIIGKDNKTTLDGFRPLYQMFNSGEVANALNVCPLKMSFPGDMKLQWGALDNGGAAKVKEQFCYVCPCKSSSLHIPQDKAMCMICQNKPETEQGGDCYHYEFVASPQVRQRLEKELAFVGTLIDETLLLRERTQQEAGGGGAEASKMFICAPGEL